MATSYVTNAVEKTGVTTTFVVVPLLVLATEGATVPAVPQAGWMDNLELNYTVTAGGPPTVVSAYLTWDVTGDIPLTTVGTMTPVAGQTVNKYGGAITIGKWYRRPQLLATDLTSTCTIYLWVKVDAGTVTFPVDGARLVCTTDYSNQS